MPTMHHLLLFLLASLLFIVAARARTWFGRKPERLDRLGAAGGGAMIALGVTLAVAD